MKILSGKPVADKILVEAKKLSSTLKKQGVKPTLAIIWVGEDKETAIFVKRKEEKAKELGIEFKLFHLHEDEASEQGLVSLVEQLNMDAKIHGVVVQLPLPETIHAKKILGYLSTKKDVDGFTHFNLEALQEGVRPHFVPAVAEAVLELLNFYKIDIAGKNIVVLGKGGFVGKPIGELLELEGGKIKFFDAHKKPKTVEIAQADVIIGAAGEAEIFGKEFVNSSAIVIDVGTTLKNKHICGDFKASEIKDKVLGATPVPGGVGPITVAVLLRNVVRAAEMLLKNS